MAFGNIQDFCSILPVSFQVFFSLQFNMFPRYKVRCYRWHTVGPICKSPCFCHATKPAHPLLLIFRQFFWVFNQEVLEEVGNFLRNSACTCRKPYTGLLRQLPSGSVEQGRFFLSPANLSHCDFVVFLAGWERVWNRRSCMGKDQGFLLVARHGGVLEGHFQAAGNVWHAVGPVVWWWQVLWGESRVRWTLL